MLADFPYRPADDLAVPFWSALDVSKGFHADNLVTCTSLCVWVGGDLDALAFVETFRRLMDELAGSEELHGVAQNLLGLGEQRLSAWQWHASRSACVALGLGVFTKAQREPRLLEMMPFDPRRWAFDYLGAFDAQFAQLHFESIC